MAVGPQFRRVGAEEIDWHRVSQLTLVPFLADGRAVLDADGERARLVVGEIEAGEHPLADAPTRIALEQCGFRRQATHPFAVTDAGSHVAMWVDGDRYAGDRAHKQHATWWTGNASTAADVLRDAGDPDAAALVEMAADARDGLTDAQFWSDGQRVLDPAYLAAETAEGGSGFGGTAEDWRAERSVLCDSIDRNGSFLDTGCANGHLMESVVQWCAERDITVEPYGVDISEPLVELARRRLPRWRDRIWVGNALKWIPPEGARFDVVHAQFDCVPEARRGDLVRHLLAHAVAPGGRLVVSHYNAGIDAKRRPSVLLEGLGFDVAGETRVPVRANGTSRQPSAWIDAP